MRRCAACRRPIATDADPAAGVLKHAGRGLCGTCRKNEDVRLDHPRRLRPADALLDDWTALRLRGCTREEATPKLGLTLEGLERMLQRHRDDPRARMGVRRRGPRRWDQWRPRDAYGRWTVAG